MGRLLTLYLVLCRGIPRQCMDYPEIRAWWIIIDIFYSADGLEF
jgi:hypothetical protein